MVRPDSPRWQAEVQAATPHWGTTHPLRLDEILGIPLYDTDGRNALESKKGNLVGVPMEYVLLPYEGREKTKGNVSAMGAIRRRDTRIIQTIADLRAVMFPHETPTFEGITAVVNAAIMYPNFMVHRSDNPVANGEIDPVVTGAKKAMRGIALPLQIVQQQKIEDDYAGVQSDVDVSFLESPAAYLRHSKSLLEGAAGIGCPADEEIILTSLHALLDKPTDSKEALSRLGLTVDEARRLKLLGLAFTMGVLEEKVWNETHFGIAAEEYAHLKSIGMTDPLNLQVVQDRAKEVLSRLNFAQQLANKVLGRDEPPKVAIAHIKRPELVVIED